MARKGTKWIVVMVVLLLAVGIAGAVGTSQLRTARQEEVESSSASEPVEVPSEEPAESQQSPETPDGSAANPLTGMPIEEEAAENRPVAVMINNIKKAQPLLGVQQADVIYECLVEGGITRLMAVYQEPDKMEVVGSVRSARPYYIHLAKGLDAVYVHVGGSNQARELLDTGLVPDFDLGKLDHLMWRDPQRRAQLGYEHSAVTSGELLTQGMKEKQVRTKLRENRPDTTLFGPNSPVLQGEDTSRLSVSFSSYKTTDFTYNSQKQEYEISQFGAPQTDGNTGGQVSKPNILVLTINTYPIDDYGLQAMDLKGEGTGTYISKGKRIEIKWSRETEDSPFVYTTPGGQALTMLPGQFYICCAPKKARITFS